jgi:shikimate dehydrogenase
MNPSHLQFALFGNPVAHSLSPVMHRAAYEALGLNAEYSAYCVVNLEKALSGVRGMGIRGVSVTLPFKESVLPFLDEVDRTAIEIGAVNTVRNDNGRLSGFNTDVSGLMDDLENVSSGRQCACPGSRRGSPLRHFRPPSAEPP